MSLRVPVDFSTQTLKDWGRKVANAINQIAVQYLPLTGGTLTGDLSVPDEAYGVSWNGSLEVPTKNAVYDKIETLGGAGVTTTGSPANGNLTKFSGAATITNGDLSGDVTTSGTLSATIANDAVTYAKMQDVSATSRFLGRITAGAGDVEELTAANAKTILGLAQADISGLTTADSPQFTALNIGHASDTTLARSGAGDLTIEGNAIYRAGGTDVPLADGGTGASLVDPNADRLLFWDESAGQVTWLELHANLEISGTTLKPKSRGALVTKAADQTTANYSAGANVAWDTESYDTDTIHDNVTNNSRLTVPSGVTKVRLSFCITLELVAAGSDTYAFLFKNGASAFVGNALTTADQVSLTSVYLNGTSAVLTVTSGDYFEVRLICSDASITVTKDVSWFAMEIIE